MFDFITYHALSELLEATFDLCLVVVCVQVHAKTDNHVEQVLKLWLSLLFLEHALDQTADVGQDIV